MTTTQIKMQDADGAPLLLNAIEEGGTLTPMQRVTNIERTFRDGFAFPYGNNWVEDNPPDGSTVTQSNGQLTLASGTNAGAYIVLTSKETFETPCRVMIGMQNTRQANNHHIFELVSVDPVTGIPDGKSSIQWDIGGAASTTVTQGRYYTQSGGLTPLESGASTIVSTTSQSILEMEPYSEEVWFHSKSMDSTGGRSNSYKRDSIVPNSNSIYKLRVRMMNHGAWQAITGAAAVVAGTDNTIRIIKTAHGLTTGQKAWVEGLNGVLNGTAPVVGNYLTTVVDANTFELQGTVFNGAYIFGSGRFAAALSPAASTNLILQFMSVQDHDEVIVEISNARGSNATGQALAVQVANTVNVNAVQVANNLSNTITTSALTANQTVTGSARDTGVAAGSIGRYNRYTVTCSTNQVGTVRIECSTDNSTWRRVTEDIASPAVAANQAATIVSVPIVTRYYRTVYINGANATTAAGTMIADAFLGSN